MFIKRTKRKQGNKEYISISLVEGYRENGKVKHRNILNISKWDNKLINDLERILKGKSVYNLDDLTIKSGKAFGAIYVLNKISEEIGINKCLGNDKNAKLTLAMIFGRILNQGSRLGLVSWQEYQSVEEVLGIEKFNEDQLYKAMDWLDNNQEDIEKKLWNYRYKEKAPELFLYDVTSSYFEGEYNELAEYGYNRDGKKYKKQIVIGLLTDQEGIPIAVRVFKGNTQDPKTVELQIKALAEQFGVKKITFVGDKGMIKSTQKELIEEKDWYWITTITKAQIKTLINNEIIQLSFFDKDIVEVGYENIRYILRKNPLRVLEIKKSREEKLEKLRKKIEEKNEYLKNHARAKTETGFKEINNWIKTKKIDDCIKLELNNREIKLIIDEKELIKKGQLDGCYVIQSNLPKDKASSEIIHNRYKDLYEIEEHFRNMKTTSLEIRPIYHRKAERTRALVFIAMLARMITKLFYDKTALIESSLDHKLKILDHIQFNILEIKGNKKKLLPKQFNNTQEKILNILNIKLPQIL